MIKIDFGDSVSDIKAGIPSRWKGVGWRDAKGNLAEIGVSSPSGKTWQEFIDKGLHPHLLDPGYVKCGKDFVSKEGWAFPGAVRYIPANDPRGPEAALAITIFYPTVIWNHTFNSLFIPRGSLLTGRIVPTVFAFPLDAKVVTDDMISLAIDAIKAGKFDSVVSSSGLTMNAVIGKMADYGSQGWKKAGPVGAVVGAWIGGIASWFTGVFGKQEWDAPDDLESYVNQNTKLRTQAGINFRYSHGDRGRLCAVLHIDAKGQYTVMEAWNKIKEIVSGKRQTPTEAASLPGKAPWGTPPPRLGTSSPRACAFIGNRQAFPCSSTGLRAAKQAARSTRTPLFLIYGNTQINMSRCLRVPQQRVAQTYQQPQRQRYGHQRARPRRRGLRGGLGSAIMLTENSDGMPFLGIGLSLITVFSLATHFVIRAARPAKRRS